MKLSLSAKPSVFTPEMLQLIQFWYSGVFVNKLKISKKEIELLVEIGKLLPAQETRKMYRLAMQKIENPLDVKEWKKGKTYLAKNMTNKIVSFTDSVKDANRFYKDNYKSRAPVGYVATIISCTVPGSDQIINTNALVDALKADKQTSLLVKLMVFIKEKETICILTEPITATVERVLLPT